MSTDVTPQDQLPPPPPEVSPATTSAAATPTVAPPEAPPPTKPETTPPPPTSDSRKPAPEPDIVTVPTYSRWFLWDAIHECEVRHMPEFFDGKSPSKNPTVYKYYRNSIIKKFRANPTRKTTFTEVRRTIVGDVGSIRRVFDFLDTWGLINYSPSGKQPFKWEEKESKSSLAAAAAAATAPPPSPAAAAGGGDATGAASADANGERSKKWCSGCKAACAIACFVSDKYDLVLCARCFVRGNYRVGVSSSEFRRIEIISEPVKWCSGCKAGCATACFVCDKHDLVLCARCYVRGNYRVGVSSSEFRRVEISEPMKTDWTDKETLHLLEAIMHFGDDWKRISEHVGGRSEKECIAHFIKLPFGEQFVEPTDQGEEDSTSYQSKDQNNAEPGIEPSAKRRHLTPLADASNPIMAQAAFLSALAGVEVSEAAARAAVATLYDMDHVTSGGSVLFQAPSSREQGPAVASNGDSSFCAPEEVRAGAESLLKQEEDEFLNSISAIIEVKMKEVLDKIVCYDQMELQLEMERHQLQQMKHQLFLDQLTLLFNKAAAPKSVENVVEENVRTELTTSS